MERKEVSPTDQGGRTLRKPHSGSELHPFLSQARGWGRMKVSPLPTARVGGCTQPEAAKPPRFSVRGRSSYNQQHLHLRAGTQPPPRLGASGGNARFPVQWKRCSPAGSLAQHEKSGGAQALPGELTASGEDRYVNTRAPFCGERGTQRWKANLPAPSRAGWKVSPRR